MLKSNNCQIQEKKKERKGMEKRKLIEIVIKIVIETVIENYRNL